MRLAHEEAQTVLPLGPSPSRSGVRQASLEVRKAGSTRDFVFRGAEVLNHAPAAGNCSSKSSGKLYSNDRAFSV